MPRTLKWKLAAIIPPRLTGLSCSTVATRRLGKSETMLVSFRIRFEFSLSLLVVASSCSSHRFFFLSADCFFSCEDKETFLSFVWGESASEGVLGTIGSFRHIEHSCRFQSSVQSAIPPHRNEQSQRVSRVSESQVKPELSCFL